MMKKIINTSIVLLGLLLLNLPHAFCQDTTMTKNDNEETEDQNAPRPKPHKGASYLALGVEAGLNVTDFLYSQSNGGLTSKPLAQGRAGVLLDIPIHGVFYIQPGVFYVMNGHGDNSAGDNSTININSIEVPINAMFKFRMRNNNLLFVGAGPFIGYNVSGTASSGSFKIGSDANDNIKAVDYGIGVNAGYELKCGLFFRARYQWGLANLQPQNNSYISTINSESYGVQVGYFFGRKAHCQLPDDIKDQPMPKAWDE